MTTELMVNEYILHVLKLGAAAPRVFLDSCTKPACPVVIYDLHASHVAPATLDKFASVRLKPIALPGGSTSVLQPMDLAINKPFKGFMREEYGTPFSLFLMLSRHLTSHFVNSDGTSSWKPTWPLLLAVG